MAAGVVAAYWFLAHWQEEGFPLAHGRPNAAAAATSGLPGAALQVYTGQPLSVFAVLVAVRRTGRAGRNNTARPGMVAGSSRR